MNAASLPPLLLAEWPTVQAIYLFGSQARGDARADSDVDVAVLLPKPVDAVERWHVQERLAAKLGADVDLVDLRSASTVMRTEVVQQGRLLHDGHRGERELFEALTLSAYARLQEERRGILDDIRARGRAHD